MKLDPNIALLCTTVLVGLTIIFGSLTKNPRWNMEAKCRMAAEQAVEAAMAK